MRDAELICVNCPKGCRVTVHLEDNKITEIEGILTAYKLFYVGCSRARKNLIIMVEKNKIMNFKEKFVDKAKKIGFTVLS